MYFDIFLADFRHVILAKISKSREMLYQGTKSSLNKYTDTGTQAIT